MDITAELRRKAGERLCAICHQARLGRITDVRTKLDEWKAFTVGGDLVTYPGLRQRWLNNPCPWQHHARLREYMDWRTPEALWILEQGEKRNPAVKKPKKGMPAPYRLIVDHSVPIKILTEFIMEDRSLWEPDRLERFLSIWYRRGVLTKDQDRLLDNAGLRQSMPQGWRFGDDPFARYRYVGLQNA